MKIFFFVELGIAAQVCQTVKKPRAFAISLGLLPGTGYRLSDSQALDSSFFTVWCDATMNPRR